MTVGVHPVDREAGEQPEMHGLSEAHAHGDHSLIHLWDERAVVARQPEFWGQPCGVMNRGTAAIYAIGQAARRG